MLKTKGISIILHPRKWQYCIFRLNCFSPKHWKVSSVKSVRLHIQLDWIGFWSDAWNSNCFILCLFLHKNLHTHTHPHSHHHIQCLTLSHSLEISIYFYMHVCMLFHLISSVWVNWKSTMSLYNSIHRERLLMFFIRVFHVLFYLIRCIGWLMQLMQ